jgi:hypothetical protein
MESIVVLVILGVACYVGYKIYQKNWGKKVEPQIDDEGE